VLVRNITDDGSVEYYEPEEGSYNKFLSNIIRRLIRE
jgi:hypothetical protein